MGVYQEMFCRFDGTPLKTKGKYIKILNFYNEFPNFTRLPCIFRRYPGVFSVSVSLLTEGKYPLRIMRLK